MAIGRDKLLVTQMLQGSAALLVAAGRGIAQWDSHASGQGGGAAWEARSIGTGILVVAGRVLTMIAARGLVMRSLLAGMGVPRGRRTSFACIVTG
jgi:hypothetical protein